MQASPFSNIYNVAILIRFRARGNVLALFLVHIKNQLSTCIFLFPTSDVGSDHSTCLLPFLLISTLLSTCFSVTNDQVCIPVSYTHLRAHETRHEFVCRLLL